MQRALRQIISILVVIFAAFMAVRYANNALSVEIAKSITDPLNPKFINFTTLYESRHNITSSAFIICAVNNYQIYRVRATTAQRAFLKDKYGEFFSKLLQNNELIFHYEKIIKRILKNSTFLRLTDIICNFRSVAYTSNVPNRRLHELGLTILRNISKAYKEREIEISQKTLPSLLLTTELVKDVDTKTQLIEKVAAFENYLDEELAIIFKQLGIFVEDDVKEAFRTLLLVTILTSTYETIAADLVEWESHNLSLASAYNPAVYHIGNRRYGIMSTLPRTVAYNLLSHALLFNIINDYKGENVFQLLGSIFYMANPKNDVLDSYERCKAILGTQNLNLYYAGTLPGTLIGLMLELSVKDNFSVQELESPTYRIQTPKKLIQYTKTTTDILPHGIFRIIIGTIMIFFGLGLMRTCGGLINIYRAVRGQYIVAEVPYGEFYALLMFVQTTMAILYSVIPAYLLLWVTMSPKLLPIVSAKSPFTNSHISILYSGFVKRFLLGVISGVLKSTATTIVANTLILWGFDEYQAWNCQFFYNYFSYVTTVVTIIFSAYYTTSAVTRVQFGMTPFKLLVSEKILRNKQILVNSSPKAVGYLPVQLVKENNPARYLYVSDFPQCENLYLLRFIGLFSYLLYLLTLCFFLFIKPYVVTWAPVEYTPIY